MSVVYTELKAKIILELTEDEAGALDAICGYGDAAFIRIFTPFFEEHMGKTYIAPYKKAIPSLFAKARELKVEVDRLRKIREDIQKSKGNLVIVS